MKIKNLTLVLVFALVGSFSYAQLPTIKWQNTIGGFANDSLVSILPTPDGGFIISGQSNSNISGAKTQNSIGDYDYWIVKVNSSGKVKWDKTIGGTGLDKVPYIINTLDGGFLVGGTSISDSTGNKTENAINQSDDYWVLKLDKKGKVEWNNTIGAIQTEKLYGLAQDKDSSYRVTGISYTNFSQNDKSMDNFGSSVWGDYWLLKLDKNGTLIQDYLYGGQNADFVTSIIPVKEDGYIMGGYSYSKNDGVKTQKFVGNNDYWIVRVDKNGVKKWDKTIGGSRSDFGSDIQQTFDRGYIISGYSNSPVSSAKTAGWKGVTDYWVVKTDSSGTVVWDKTYGGTLGDYLASGQQTKDSGFIIGGTSSSGISSDKSESSRGLDDYWIMKLDKSGNKVWDKTYGGSANDRLSAIKEISAGEYIVGGTSNSPKSGDKTKKTTGGGGANDYWILRLTTNAVAKAETKSTKEESYVKSSAPFNIGKLTMRANPNPTKGPVTLNYSSTENEKISLAVYGNNGKVILSQELASNKNTYTFSLSQQPAGVYYVVVTSNKNTVTRVVIKE